MNRKRAVSLLLAAVLLLTLPAGCSKPDSKKGGKDDPAETAAPTVPQPRSVEVGGVQIYLDESQYTPYKPEEQICTPISEGPLDEFKPSMHYGDVFPYVAGRLYSGSEDGYSWETGNLYGLADSQGRMLTDGIYVSAYPLYSYLPGSDGDERLPFIVVTRNTDVTVIRHESEYGDWDEIHSIRESALVSMDGTFLIPFSASTFGGYENCIIALRRDHLEDDMMPSKEFVVYDLQGEVLFYSADIPIDRSCDYVSVMESEGIVKVSQNSYDDLSTKNVTDYYDLNGNHLLGPYKNGSAFSGGLACVSTDGVQYGYIDRTGRWVISPVYEDCNDFHDGLAVQTRASGRVKVVLDTTGRELMTTGGQGIYLNDDMIYVSEGYDYALRSTYNRYYDLSGNLLFEGYLYVDRISETAFIVRERDENGADDAMKVRIVDKADAEKTVTLTGIDTGAVKTAASVDGKLVRGFVCGNTRANKLYLIDASTLEISELPVAGDVNEEMNRFYAQGMQVDSLTGKTWYLVREKGRWLLFDEDEKLVFRFFSEEYPQIVNGYITAVDSTACTVYDTTGRAVFRRRLDAED